MSTSMQKKKSPKVIKKEFILRKSSKLKKVHTNGGQGSMQKFGILKWIPNLRLENISDGDNSLDPIRSRKAYWSGKTKKA